MCLSIPSEILEIDELNNALVQTLGVKEKLIWILLMSL